MLLVGDARTALEVWYMKESDTSGATRVPKRRHAKLASERRVLPICMRWGHWPPVVIGFAIFVLAMTIAQIVVLRVVKDLDATTAFRITSMYVLLSLVSLGGAAAVMSRVLRREYAALEAAGFRRCPVCLGSLADLELPGRCGTCACEFTDWGLRDKWARLYFRHANPGLWKFERATRRAVRRRKRIVAVGFVLGLLCWVGLAGVLPAFEDPPIPRWLAATSILLTCVAIASPLLLLLDLILTFTVDAARARRVRGRLRETRGRLCPACLHDLRGIGDEGQCPECGGVFSKESLADWWGSVE